VPGMKIFRRVVLIAAVLLAAAVSVAVFRIGPRNLLGMIRYDRRKEGNLRPGHAAPDVTLVSLDGKTPVRLSERAGGKPLVLIFGSYT
jgi:hypothetical protein